MGIVVGHMALDLVAFIQLLPCLRQLVAVIVPEIFVAALAVPTYIGGRFGVMPDDKLRTSDSTALYDFIAVVYAFFFLYNQTLRLIAFFRLTVCFLPSNFQLLHP